MLKKRIQPDSPKTSLICIGYEEALAGRRRKSVEGIVNKIEQRKNRWKKDAGVEMEDKFEMCDPLRGREQGQRLGGMFCYTSGCVVIAMIRDRPLRENETAGIVVFLASSTYFSECCTLCLCFWCASTSVRKVAH